MKAIKGMPLISPVRGNAFTLELEKQKRKGLTGDAAYQATQDALSNSAATMKVQYGTGSPTTLKRDKLIN